MSLIHYFPRYSQKENMVTNNTMLLFKRLSNNSNEKFNRFLNSILENSGINLDMTVKLAANALSSFRDGTFVHSHRTNILILGLSS